MSLQNDFLQIIKKSFKDTFPKVVYFKSTSVLSIVCYILTATRLSEVLTFFKIIMALKLPATNGNHLCTNLIYLISQSHLNKVIDNVLIRLKFYHFTVQYYLI